MATLVTVMEAARGAEERQTGKKMITASVRSVLQSITNVLFMIKEHQ